MSQSSFRAAKGPLLSVILLLFCGAVMPLRGVDASSESGESLKGIALLETRTKISAKSFTDLDTETGGDEAASAVNARKASKEPINLAENWSKKDVVTITIVDPGTSNVEVQNLPRALVDKILSQFGAINPNLILGPLILGFGVIVLVVTSLVGGRAPTASAVEQKRPIEWSCMAILALTSYRFYTGLLSATWMPYLLAMEGHELMGDRQSVFMGSAKLIYGMSIMMNPLFGYIGDQTTSISRWTGRRLYLVVGVGSSGIGIYGCMLAVESLSVGWYFASVTLWMVGEAMADVTTETLVPELIPKKQYELSGNLRSINFFVGGITGYVLLICLRSYHYIWLYYLYLVSSIVCAFLSLVFIDESRQPNTPEPTPRTQVEFRTALTQAYIQPMAIRGMFPRWCFAQFVFSLGTAPMFFLLLIVRDVVGMREPTLRQLQFSVTSIIFLSSAALAPAVVKLVAGVAGGCSSDGASTPRTGTGLRKDMAPQDDREFAAGGRPSGGEGGDYANESPQKFIARWQSMTTSSIAFAVVAIAIPIIALFPTNKMRMLAMYVIAGCMGLSFGSVYARFQECSWSLLPPGLNTGNALGFAAMCKLAGVGLGSFVAGFALDYRSKGPEEYMVSGYVLMCFGCAVVVAISAMLSHSIGQLGMNQKREASKV